MGCTLFKRRGNPLWYIEWMDGNERRELCLNTADDAEAERFSIAEHLVPVAAAAATPDPAPEAPTYLVAHALEDFIARGCADNAQGTIDCYTNGAGHILRILGDQPLQRLHLDAVQGYIDARLSEDAARETVRKELCVLRRTIDLAHRRGIPSPSPADVLPRFRTRYVPRKVWLSQPQCEDLLKYLEPSRRLFVLVGVYTGARLSELVGLCWQDVDFAGALVHLRGRKTDNSDRITSLHPRLAEALRPLRKVRGPVLRPWGNVRRDLAVACKHIGVPRVTPNDLRRTFASWLVQAGESSYVVSQLLGHGSSTMVERVYGRLARKTLHDAVSKLPH